MLIRIIIYHVILYMSYTQNHVIFAFLLLFFHIIFILGVLMQKPFFKFTEAYNDNGTVWYTIQVHAKGNDPEPIIFKQRYSQLREIHERCMETQFRNDLPDFPAKKFFGATKQDFIQKRKKQLENYYNTLSKTVNIQKLVQLNKFIESQRKKKPQAKPSSKAKDEDNNKMEVNYKKQTQLKNAFENTCKEVLNQIIDLNGDFYPMQEIPHDDNSKRYTSQIQQIKPQQSRILQPNKLQGLEQNETDFWSMFLKDEHQENLIKCKNSLVLFNQIQKQVGGLNKQNIVVVK